jgi:hypothetical protein
MNIESLKRATELMIELCKMKIAGPADPWREVEIRAELDGLVNHPVGAN